MNSSQLVNGKLWVHFKGKTFVFESKKKSWGKASGGGSKAGSLIAPMPGKITKILKSVNEKVSAGDVVLVMEAMKMEYTLKADLDGSLQALNCKVGDQVSLGKILAEIK
jgi:acetyl/propionyl-CoA carboxylase alpha subunit